MRSLLFIYYSILAVALNATKVDVEQSDLDDTMQSCAGENLDDVDEVEYFNGEGIAFDEKEIEEEMEKTARLRHSFYLEPPTLDEFEATLWHGQDEAGPESRFNLLAPSVVPFVLVEFSSKRRSNSPGYDLEVTEPREFSKPKLRTSWISKSESGSQTLFKLYAFGEQAVGRIFGSQPVGKQDEPLTYELLDGSEYFHLSDDANCGRAVVGVNSNNPRCRDCFLCMRSEAVNDALHSNEAIAAIIKVEDTWGEPRMRAYTTVQLAKEIPEPDFDGTDISRPLGPGQGRVSTEAIQELLQERGIHNLRSNFAIGGDASKIAVFVDEVMRMAGAREKPAEEYISQQINRYLHLEQAKNEWRVLKIDNGKSCSWTVPTPTAPNSFVAFEVTAGSVKKTFSVLRQEPGTVMRETTFYEAKQDDAT